MSMWHTWSFRIPLRADLDAATLRVLEAVARDTAPAPEDLARLHPVVAHYLGNWTRLLTGEEPPFVGPPLRLSGHWSGDRVLAVDFSQHDDEFANGGYVLWAWALQLIARPGRGRVLIGHHAPDRDDLTWYPVVAGPDGVDEGRGRVLTWAEIERGWAEMLDDTSWATYPD